MTTDTGSASALIRRYTRNVPDFPVAGVVFADLTPAFADAETFAAIVTELSAGTGGDRGVDLVAGLDSRGFLLAAAVATRLGTGILAVRKAGKLPPPVLRREYDLEYGSAALEIPADAIPLAGRRVLVVDDVLATGGTMNAAVSLLEEAGAEVVGIRVVKELPALGGRAVLAGRDVRALLAG